jgi:hypothetical protein
MRTDYNNPNERRLNDINYQESDTNYQQPD